MNVVPLWVPRHSSSAHLSISACLVQYQLALIPHWRVIVESNAHGFSSAISVLTKVALENIYRSCSSTNLSLIPLWYQDLVSSTQLSLHQSGTRLYRAVKSRSSIPWCITLSFGFKFWQHASQVINFQIFIHWMDTMNLKGCMDMQDKSKSYIAYAG